jgi:hypothetical protein
MEVIHEIKKVLVNDSYMNVQNSFIFNSPKLEIIQIFIYR